MTQEINGTVEVFGLTVSPGDLVICDETGICFVPQNLILEVLELAEAADAKEVEWVEKLDAGPKGAVLSFRDNSFAHPEKLVAFIHREGQWQRCARI